MKTSWKCLSEYSDFIEFIDKIDNLFRKFIAVELQGDPFAATLFMNAHASFLAAARLAVSGQTPPTFMALRGALESALYGLIASQSEENRLVWVNRDRDLKRSRRLLYCSEGPKPSQERSKSVRGSLRSIRIDGRVWCTSERTLGDRAFKAQRAPRSIPNLFAGHFVGGCCTHYRSMYRNRLGYSQYLPARFPRSRISNGRAWRSVQNSK